MTVNRLCIFVVKNRPWNFYNFFIFCTSIPHWNSASSLVKCEITPSLSRTYDFSLVLRSVLHDRVQQLSGSRETRVYGENQEMCKRYFFCRDFKRWTVRGRFYNIWISFLVSCGSLIKRVSSSRVSRVRRIHKSKEFSQVRTIGPPIRREKHEWDVLSSSGLRTERSLKELSVVSWVSWDRDPYKGSRCFKRPRMGLERTFYVK